ncbi:SAM-dependent methyltransferase [Anaerosolibacter carboniphilus]|uniref:SAM-dependent methyltransferase n=1 Tax=Anaerosolibacter carboniphilus TaxID=1417629 RepID=A0A841KZY5_9FIRM|nr:methyltransferase domain-containing protein [Anaerosolibacter carboniphilus]MBB6217888.1 SAM-dependent methyltransferase [Anaerosolibacter carboniphilus]
MEKWFKENAYNYEADYIIYEEPWRQSGFAGPEERWEKCRKPIAELVTKSGTFLDIGCANGYLLECIMKWKFEIGINITPYGLDIGEKLVALAKERLSRFTDNMFIGNAFYWIPPMKFDYVRTELVYVPDELKKQYIERLKKDFLNEDGALLVCEYRPSKIDVQDPWVNEVLKDYGFNINEYKSAFYGGKELTRVALLR